jgi:glutamine synthetase
MTAGDAGLESHEQLRGYRRVRLELPDKHGTLRGKVLPAAKVMNGNESKICNAVMGLTVNDELFANAFSTPFTGYQDIVAVPDLSTLRDVPWESATGAVLGDYLGNDSEPHPGCQREAVRRAERRLAALGYEARVGLEFEFFLFCTDGDAIAAQRYGDLRPVSHLPQAYSLQRWPEVSRFMTQLTDDLEVYGVPVDGVHTEWGRGAMEVALKPTTPLEAADNGARFKLACREIAARHNLVPTFMAKWNHEYAGSSGHIHQSLVREGVPSFWAGRGALSDQGKAYLEGLLGATADLSAIFCPYHNSYRRPDPKFWAPTDTDWGYDNRLVCCRVVADFPETCRIELRRPGADLSIYLSVASCLAAGARGIEQGLALRPPASRDADPVLPQERLSPTQQPVTLYEATERLRRSDLARDLLGGDLIGWYVSGCEAELSKIEEMLARVAPWELERYFETV